MVTKKSGLGKGLGALIPSESMQKLESKVNEQGELIQEIDMDLIIPNKDQPRTHFDPESIESLSESIKDHGLLQPIIVKPANGFFQIIAGERRWRATKALGHSKIACIIKDVDAYTIAQLALIENLQREDLNPIEEAKAFSSLIDQYNMTQDHLSRIVGKSRSHLTNTLRLLKLEPYIQKAISEGQISNGHGRALLSLELPEKRKKLFDLIIEEALSVRKSEEYAKNFDSIFKAMGSNLKKSPVHTKLKEIVHLEEQLSSSFGTKVKISEKRGKGKITIDFYNIDDLNRILELIDKK